MDIVSRKLTLVTIVNEDLSFFAAKINGEPTAVPTMRHVMSLNFPVLSRSSQTELVDNIKTS